MTTFLFLLFFWGNLLLFLWGVLWGRWERPAAAYYLRSLRSGDYASALRRLDRIRFLLPRDGLAASKAALLLLADRAAEAELLLRQAIERGRTFSSPPFGDLCFLMGQALLDLGRYDEAEDFLRKAVKAGSLPGSVQHQMALLRILQGRVEEALVHADAALAIKKRRWVKSIPGMFNADRALALALLGRSDEAREALSRWTPERERLAPWRAALEWKTGMVLMALRQHDEGYAHLQQGHAEDPHGKFGRRCLELLRRATTEPGASSFT